jgi:hypothetical protein
MVLKDYVLEHINNGHKTLRFMSKEYVLSFNPLNTEVRILTPEQIQIISAKNKEEAASWIAEDMLKDIVSEWGPNDISGF